MNAPASARVFAVVPAAGRSRRMGRPKLLLPVRGVPVIVRVLEALRRATIHEAVVVARPDDQELARLVAHWANMVRPSPPPRDMRASVAAGLAWLRAHRAPSERDAWLLVPADSPTLTASVIEQLTTCWREGNSLAEPPVRSIWVPTYQGRRGHPVLFAWRWAAEVDRLSPERGVNHVLREHPGAVVDVPVDSAEVLADLDTPDDYRRLAAEGDDAAQCAS